MEKKKKSKKKKVNLVIKPKKTKRSRVERIFAQHKEYKELFYVDDEHIFVNEKAAKKSKMKYKIIKRK